MNRWIWTLHTQNIFIPGGLMPTSTCKFVFLYCKGNWTQFARSTSWRSQTSSLLRRKGAGKKESERERERMRVRESESSSNPEVQLWIQTQRAAAASGDGPYFSILLLLGILIAKVSIEEWGINLRKANVTDGISLEKGMEWAEILVQFWTLPNLLICTWLIC